MLGGSGSCDAFKRIRLVVGLVSRYVVLAAITNDFGIDCRVEDR